MLYDRDADPRLEIGVSRAPPGVRAELLDLSAGWRPGEVRERAARTPRFKLVETPRAGGGWNRALYDLEDDPSEVRDVSPEHPGVTARLGGILDAWAATPVAESSEGNVESLRARGYIE